MLLKQFDLNQVKRIRIGIIGQDLFENIEKTETNQIVADESGVYVFTIKDKKYSKVCFYNLALIDTLIIEYE